MLSSSQKAHIEKFKSRKHSSRSSITLAGTGPNGSAHVSILAEIGHNYLKNLQSLNIISGSCFSLFVYMANKSGDLDLGEYCNYENNSKRVHKLPAFKRVFHILSGNFKKPLYKNTCIADTFDCLLGKEMGDRTLSTVDYPVRFYSYCIRSSKIIEINKCEFPNMTLRDISRACVSIPAIHGCFKYGDYQFIDPIFSSEFISLRGDIFNMYKNQLYVNHKKTLDSRGIYFLASSESRFSNITLWLDFILFYLGIPNKNIISTHKKLVERGILN